MRKRNLSLTSAQGAETNVTAKLFFANAIADATAFLDYVGLLSPNQKRKYQYLWELLKAGRNINNILAKRKDANNIDYAWLEIELPRGKAEFKVILFSDAMFDFLVMYQNAESSVRFTLQELIDEALLIEADNQAPKQL